MMVSGTQIARMLPGRQRRDCLDTHEGADHDMADDEDDEIGRQIVGAVVVHVLAAVLAVVDDVSGSRRKACLRRNGGSGRKAAPHRLPDGRAGLPLVQLAAENLLIHHRLLRRPDRVCDARSRASRPFALWNDRCDARQRLGVAQHLEAHRAGERRRLDQPHLDAVAEPVALAAAVADRARVPSRRR